LARAQKEGIVDMNPTRTFIVLILAVAATSTSARAQDVSDPTSKAATQAAAGQAPVALAEPEAKKADPFAFADFTWLSGNPRTKETPLDSKAFTGEFRADTNFTYSFNKPIDDTISGSSEVFRSGEFQVTQLGIGGDFHYDNVQGRLMTQFGMYSQTTPRNDASSARGQWQLDAAYRYVSEAYGGYHFDKMNGINVQAGIFMSYVGLWSYYNFDNWTYQPSYVSSNTPWFFNGMRVQFFPTEKLKIEPWIINGWQSYGKFNHAPGLGGQILYRPTGSVSILFNNYWGTDTLGNPDRKRVHTDDSIQVKYYDKPEERVSKAAFTFTFDAGCEYGGGVSCGGGTAATPSQTFLGFMAYNRLWFDKDRLALTVGGGAINNPGRYLVLMPPINGATAFSGTPYFTANPGDPYKAWDVQTTFDFMPSQFATFRAEFSHRAANVPYFTGEGGVTPPGGNTGAPGSFVDGWAPDLRKSENRVTFALLVKL
jgi:Putative beta-barrel porin-2, OmpL-like. bbp2